MAKKEATFKLNVDSGDAVKDVKELDRDMTHLAETIGVEVSGSISAMEDRLYELALAGDTTSDEFKELQAQTAKYKQIVIETDRSIDALAEQGRGLSTALSLAEGTVAGFQAFTGVTALLGTENEQLLSTITKLQAAQGVLNSIQVIRQQLQENSIKLTQAQTAAQKLLTLAVGKGTKATKLLRGALLATGVGALVVGITLLIQNFDKLKSALGGVSKAQQLNNQITKEAISDAAEELSALDKLEKIVNDETKSREEKNEAVEELQSAYPSLLSNIDAETASTEELNEAIRLNAELSMLQAQINATQALRTEEIKKQIEAQTNAQSGQNQSWTAWLLSLTNSTTALEFHNAEQSHQIKQSEDQIGLLDQLSDGWSAEADAIRERLGISKENADQDEKNGQAKSDRIAKLRQQEEELNAARLNWAAQQNELIDIIAQVEEEATTSAIQRELNAVNDKYFLLIQRAEEFGLETTILKEAQEAEILAIENKFGAESYANKQKLEQAKAMLVQEGIDLQIDAMIEGQAKEEAQLRESFKARRQAIAESEALAFEERLPLILELEEQEQIALQEIRDKYREEEKAKDDELQQGKIDSVNNYLNVATDILNVIGDFQEVQKNNQLSAIDEEYDAKLKAAEGDAALTEKLEKEKEAKKIAIEKAAFERGKKLQIAMAIVQGIQGVMAAFTAGSSMGPAGVVMGPLMAALAAAGAIANIAKIKSTTFQGGGSGASAAGAYSGSATAGAGASSFAVSDNTSSAITNLNEDGTQVTEPVQPIQVFVTETDISETQDNVEQIEVKSTY